MVNFKDVFDVVFPVVSLAIMVAGVAMDYKRRLRATARKMRR